MDSKKLKAELKLTRQLLGMVTHFLHSTLNPLQARYFFVNCNIQPKNDIYPDSVDAKSAPVVTFW